VRHTVTLVIGVTIAVMVALAIGLLAATRDVHLPESWGFRGAQVLAAGTCGTVGIIVTLRRPDNRIGWIFIVIGLLFAVEAFVEAYAIASLTIASGPLPAMPAIAWLLTWMWVPAAFLALIFLPLLFPTGRLLSRTWRPVAWMGAAGMTLVTIAAAVTPGPVQQSPFIENPLVIDGLDRGRADSLTGLAMSVVFISIALAVVSLVRRYRSAADDVRRQIRWFALSAAIAGPIFVMYVLSYLFGAPTPVTKATEVAVVLSILGMPVAAGLAVLRYRLFEIDRIISRTIAYGVVTAVLVATYTAIVLVLQGPLQAVTGGETISVALSTLAAATLFQPLRARVQRSVDRRFDRARFDAERTAASFAERLRDEVALETVVAELGETVRGSLKPDGLGLWLRGTGR